MVMEMIINTGQRTDIPAFYSEWFYRRIKEGFVYVRNPYYPSKVACFQLNPKVVDCICFCTKNPKPMLSRLDELKDYRQFWHITITPYDREIEPYVPLVKNVIQSFQQLSLKIGSHAVVWRYDPVFLNDKYTLDYHLKAFYYIAKNLSGYTQQCIISFIDLYQKTKRNFPHVQEVSLEDQKIFITKCVDIAKSFDIKVYTCLEDEELAKYGAITKGCMTKEVIEQALNIELDVKDSHVRKGCRCLLGNDIGMYNTCLHGCLYCYANENKELVRKQYNLHDPHLPLLIGHLNEEDELYKVKQKSLIDLQISLDIEV